MEALKPVKKSRGLEDPALVLTFADLNQIGSMCGKNIATLEQLIAAVRELNTVTVNGQAIQLEPKLLTRLKSRCIAKDRFPQWLEEIVVKQLHDFAGW
jgi:hypothetical protein